MSIDMVAFKKVLDRMVELEIEGELLLEQKAQLERQISSNLEIVGKFLEEAGKTKVTFAGETFQVCKRTMGDHVTFYKRTEKSPEILVVE